MGNKVELKVDQREIFGKKVSKLRDQGIVPGVVYGADIEPISIQVPVNILEKAYREVGYSNPIFLNVGKKKILAMVKDMEFHPVKHVIRHVSFHAVNAKEAVIADVPIVLTGEGESAAEKAGLIVIQAMETLEVKALPMDLPNELYVSTEKLAENGDKILVSEIEIPENVEVVDYDDGREDVDDNNNSVMDLAVATAYEPSALQAANESAAGDAEEADADAVESENGDDTPQGEPDESQASGDKDGK